MVSGPLVGDEAASNRFYSRSAQNPNHVIRHSSEQSLMQQQFRGETASVDSSNNGLAEGPCGYSKVGDKVRISLSSKADVKGIKWKLMGELEQVRSLVRNLEAMEAQLNEGYGVSQKSDYNLLDNSNRSTMPFRGLSVCTSENENRGNGEGVGMMKKKKKTPKGEQSSRNVKLPPSGGKKSLARKSEVGLLLGPNKSSGRLLKSCYTLLEKLMKHKHGWVFNKPVDAKGLGLLDYNKIVKRPMDLGTVKTRLDKNWYKTAAEFAEDVRLTFNNAMLYNPKDQDVHVMAALLLKLFEEKWVAIEDEYNLNRRAEIGSDSELPTPVSRNVEDSSKYNINRRIEMGNNSELPTPISRIGTAHNINRRVDMGNNSELPSPISRKGTAQNINRRVKKGNDSELPAPFPRKVQTPAPALPLPPPSPPTEMRTLDRAESMTKPVEPKLKPATPSVGHGGRKPVPKKPKAWDPDKRDMSLEEKQKLRSDLEELPSDKLDIVVQIVKKRSQGILQQDDAIELDIGSVDPETLWELDRFVTNYNKSLTKNKRKAEFAPQSVEESDFDMQENVAQVTAEAQHEAMAVEYNENAFSPVTREERSENVSGTSNSSSGSGSSSSDSDNDSSSGSGSYSNC